MYRLVYMPTYMSWIHPRDSHAGVLPGWAHNALSHMLMAPLYRGVIDEVIHVVIMIGDYSEAA